MVLNKLLSSRSIMKYVRRAQIEKQSHFEAEYFNDLVKIIIKIII